MADSSPIHDANIIERLMRRLHGLAHHQMPDRLRARMQSEDLAYSAMNSFLRGWHDNPAWKEIDDEEDLWRLLARILRNRLIDHLRHQGAQRRDSRREVQLQELQAEFASHDTEREAEELLGLLPTENHMKEILLMYYYGNCSDREIAEALSLSRPTVERRRKEALTRLRRLAGDDL